MAKHAEKKAAETAAYWSDKLMILLVVLNVAYLASLAYEATTKDDYQWSLWTIFWIGFYAYLEYKAY